MMKLSKLLEKFCDEHENYTYHSQYYKEFRYDFTDDVWNCNCPGIVVRKDCSCMEMLMELTEYLSGMGFEDVNFELEDWSVEAFGEDTIVYFPYAEEAKSSYVLCI